MNWPQFGDDLERHVRNLGYVPPELRRHGRFLDDDLPDFLPVERTPTTNAGMRALMSMEEWWAMENAAILSHRTRTGDSSAAESARDRGGYGGLGREKFGIPDQRPLLGDPNE